MMPKVLGKTIIFNSRCYRIYETKLENHMNIIYPFAGSLCTSINDAYGVSTKSFMIILQTW